MNALTSASVARTAPGPAPRRDRGSLAAPLPESRGVERAQIVAAIERPSRHPGDVVRAVVGMAGVVLLGLAARRPQVPRVEQDLFRLINNLPGWLEAPLWLAMQAGSLAAVPVSAGAALAARKPRLARDLALSGAAAYLLAKVVKGVVDRGRPAAELLDVLVRGTPQSGLGFPSGHAAVAAALATAAVPYLPRRARRLLWAVVILVGIARSYVGAHLPADVVGGVALGWAVGSLVHLAWGAPGRGVSLDGVLACLRRVGLDPSGLRVLFVDARGSVPFVLDSGEDKLFVKALGREQRDGDALFKLWRRTRLRGTEDEAPFVSPNQQVEHEAYVTLLAARSGARVPRLVATSAIGDGTAIFATELIDATPLDGVEPQRFTDAVLADIWGQVASLRSSRIAHRDLRLANILLDDQGRTWLIDFGFSEVGASDHLLAQDVAGLLASLALVVGARRAVGTARSVLGADALASAGPFLQPLAFVSSTRRVLRHERSLVGELRAEVSRASGVDHIALEPLARVRWTTVLLLLGGAFAIHALLPQFGEIGQTADAIRGADPWWLVAVLVYSTMTYVSAGIAQLGVSPDRTPLGRSVWVQLASSFTNRLMPANLGGAAVNERFLEKNGVEPSDAVGLVGMKVAAGAIVHVVLLTIAVVLMGQRRVLQDPLPRGWALLVIALGLLVGAGAVVGTPFGRERLLLPIRSTLRRLGHVTRRPLKATELFGGSVGVTLFYVLAMAASLSAFHAGVSLPTAAAVYLGGTAVASAAPTPGGLGAVELALIAGYTAVGVDSGSAVAAVLAFRLVTFWLPILPGGLTLYRLRRAHAL